MNDFYNNELIQLAIKVRNNLNPNPNYLMPINDYPHLFLLGCIMDRRINFEKAWNIPLQVANELGSKDFQVFLSKNQDYYIDLFIHRKYHRLNKEMAICFYQAIQKIKSDYKGNAANIWNDNPSFTVLKKRLMDFKGVGDNISSMIINILERRGLIKINDKSGLDISADINVKRVMYRMGWINNIDNNYDAIIAAREHNPVFPGVFDKLLWKVGKEYCLSKESKCDICLVSKYCKKFTNKLY